MECMYNMYVCMHHPRITWLSTVQQDLKQHHLTLPKAADLAQNRPLCWMMSDVWRYAIVRVACQKRRRRCMQYVCNLSNCIISNELE